MPELPEVESFARSLQQQYGGKKISTISFHRDDIRFPLDKIALSNIFSKGCTLIKVFRVDKKLVLQTENGCVHVSLGMSGYFAPAIKGKPEKHEHITIQFDDNHALAFVDPRRFGFWKIVDECGLFVANPLSERSLAELFSSPKRKSLRDIKSFLMDQTLIGGVGNIYALEALFLAGVKPTKRCGRLRKDDWMKIAFQLPKVLEKAIEKGGSTISSYRKLDGDAGGFQASHFVYNRDSQPCLKKGCTSSIKRIKQGGRSSWFCPACQK